MLSLLPFRTFLDEESGAVTIDWVVISAIIIALALGVTLAVTQGITETTGAINRDLDTASRMGATINSTINN